MQAAIVGNEQQKCKVDGCYTTRWRISGYCQHHSDNQQRWGHPEGLDIPDARLTIAFDQIQKVIAANPEHKGIAIGKRFFEQWMVVAVATIKLSPPMVPTGRHLVRLADFNVHPLDCLTVVGSVWLFATRDRGRFVKGDEHTRAVMGQKLFALAPMRGEHQKTGQERKAAGKYIQDSIGVLLVTLADAVEQMEQRGQTRLKAMGSALDIP
ncbi:hypothetical protein [uncultured Desulfosarcina sp.]|uniref:hypothetical protein n=1 Tax=uncultured Desulfosarcina sp. TaxID=218289 RepID=UPI0029C8BF81|nr:hypothetical protein [uncultured Desulfosarcina sp.]